MKNALIIAAAVLGLAAILLTGFYAYFMYSLKAMHKKQTIAENVQVTSDWQEITPEKPLKITKQVQQIMLVIENYEGDPAKNDFGNIHLTDGTKINPEVQIVDEDGKIYYLRDGLRLGSNVGFSVNKEIHGTYDLPKEVAYKSVRIRSDQPFRCIKIYWYDHDLK